MVSGMLHMTRTLLLCFGMSLLACSADEEPVGAGSSGGAGAAGSSAGTSEPGDSAQDRSNPDGADTSSDAPPGDAPRGDAALEGDAALNGDAFACPPQFDGGGSFPAVLRQGIWPIGWSGGLDHYSWLKFNFLVDGGLHGLF